MTTFQLPKVFDLLAAVIGLSLATAGYAQALDLPKSEVAELGKSVSAAAHSTGKDHRVTQYSFRGDSVYMTVKYEGAFSNATHTAEVRVDFDPKSGKVTSYDYNDLTNWVPPSRSGIERELARWTVR